MNKVNEFEAPPPPQEPFSDEDGEYSVDNPPWGIFSALGVWLFSVLTIVLFGTVAVLIYSSSTGASLESIADFQHSLAVDLQLLSTLPAHLFTIALAYFVITRTGETDWRKTLGMEWGGFRWWYVILFMLVFFALGAGLTQIFEAKDNTIERAIAASPNAIFIIALIATFSAPIVEEVVYRGVLYGAVDKLGGTSMAIAVVTLLFALVHVPQYAGDYTVIVLLVGLSLALTVVRALTNNLWPCIFIHFVFNGIQSIGLIVQKYLPPDVG